MAEHKCGVSFVTLRKRVENTEVLRSIPLRCKSWSCPHCAVKKANKYAKIMDVLFRKKQLYFYTFTFRHDGTPLEVWGSAGAAWNRLNTAIHRRYKTHAYIRILESHVESPYPHYHICSTRLYSAVWLGKELRKAGFGWNAEIKRVNSSGLGFYLRKYLVKSWPRADAAEIRKDLGLRVFNTSRGLFPHSVPVHEWSFIGTSNCRAAAVEICFTSSQWCSTDNRSIIETELKGGGYEISYSIPPPACPICPSSVNGRSGIELAPINMQTSFFDEIRLAVSRRYYN